MTPENLIVYLSQVHKKPFRTIDDLKEKYNEEYGASKLKNNIKKVLDSIGKGEGNPMPSEKLDAMQNGLGKLQDILVSFGGIGIISNRDYYEEDIKEIIERGQLWLAHGVMKKKGEENQCHRNSVRLWDANKDKDVYVATGYALSEDGWWRQHSWCLYKKPKSVSVVETTSPKRIAYFGYAMTFDEAEKFYADNN